MSGPGGAGLENGVSRSEVAHNRATSAHAIASGGGAARREPHPQRAPAYAWHHLSRRGACRFAMATSSCGAAPRGFIITACCRSRRESMRSRAPHASISRSAARVKTSPPWIDAVSPRSCVGAALRLRRAALEPAPLAPDAAASAFNARSLADPGLRSFEERSLGRSIETWPPAEWDLETLSLAALYFNPQLDEARASVAESQAALKTAGARPNPTLSVTPGVPSPYLLTLDLSFPLETAGKRGYRIQAARNLELASRLELAQTAWTIRSAVRAALLDYLMSLQSLDLLRSEAEERETQVRILDRCSRPASPAGWRSMRRAASSRGRTPRCARRRKQARSRPPSSPRRSASPRRHCATRAFPGPT